MLLSTIVLQVGAAAALSTAGGNYEMKSLTTLMANLNHEFVDILKIDIEGQVIHDVICIMEHPTVFFTIH